MIDIQGFFHYSQKPAYPISNTENRLIAVEPQNPVDGDKKVEFTYDYIDRRKRKKVSS